MSLLVSRVRGWQCISNSGKTEALVECFKCSKRENFLHLLYRSLKIRGKPDATQGSAMPLASSKQILIFISNSNAKISSVRLS